MATECLVCHDTYEDLSEHLRLNLKGCGTSGARFLMAGLIMTHLLVKKFEEMEPRRTVRDLIDELSVLSPDAVVSLAGCDCTARWCGHIEVSDTEVYLQRDDRCDECGDNGQVSDITESQQ